MLDRVAGLCNLIGGLDRNIREMPFAGAPSFIDTIRREPRLSRAEEAELVVLPVVRRSHNSQQGKLTVCTCSWLTLGKRQILLRSLWNGFGVWFCQLYVSFLKNVSV